MARANSTGEIVEVPTGAVVEEVPLRWAVAIDPVSKGAVAIDPSPTGASHPGPRGAIAIETVKSAQDRPPRGAVPIETTPIGAVAHEHHYGATAEEIILTRPVEEATDVGAKTDETIVHAVVDESVRGAKEIVIMFFSDGLFPALDLFPAPDLFPEQPTAEVAFRSAQSGAVEVGHR